MLHAGFQKQFRRCKISSKVTGEAGVKTRFIKIKKIIRNIDNFLRLFYACLMILLIGFSFILWKLTKKGK